MESLTFKKKKKKKKKKAATRDGEMLGQAVKRAWFLIY